MNEFAPEYSKKERLVLLLKHMTWAVPLFAITKYLFFPWLEVYAENAHCYTYGKITGTEVVFHGLFVGLPLMSAIIILLMEGRRCINILNLGQDPLPGEKVFMPTKYRYGFRAKSKAYIFILVVLFLIGLSIKGVSSASKVVEMVNPKELHACK